MTVAYSDTVVQLKKLFGFVANLEEVFIVCAGMSDMLVWRQKIVFNCVTESCGV